MSGLFTTVALLAFTAVVVWVFVVKRKEDFDEQARLPLEENEDLPEQDRGRNNDRESKENSK